MDRVIKFRGKRVDNGEWVYGYYVKNREEDTCIIHYEKQIDFFNKYIENWYAVIPSSVGQFTGLTDLNKKEWFEHDITEGGYVVKFFNGGWACYKSENNWFPLDEDNAKYKKIIGNTHDKEEVK